MAEVALAEVYAEALDGLVARGGEAARVPEELEAFREALAAEPRLRVFLATPAIPDEAKKKLLRKALLPASLETANFLQLLIDHRRLDLLDAICRALWHRRREREGRIEATAWVAHEATEALKRRIARAVERRYGKRVALSVEVHPSILGGILLRVGDEVFDGTLRGRLERVRRMLLKSREEERALWGEG